jgi:2-polyprenyl-3-methyl-5-hydroxy-6-metoxy-1,4-benzoquinol methylase
LVEPHEWKYDLLCTAATDPYTQCGYVKLIPISHFEDFTIEHLPNKYVGKLGVDGSELWAQVQSLMQMSTVCLKPTAPLHTETKLKHGLFSKDYYEPVNAAVAAAIPSDVRSVLSVGCGWGATERSLAEKGRRVLAVALDPVIASTAAASGVQAISGNLREIRDKVGTEKFDCVLYLNLLHLVRDPFEVFSLFTDCLSPKGIAIIQSPNMLSGPSILKMVRDTRRLRDIGHFDATGVRFVFAGRVRKWCEDAGLRMDQIRGVGLVRQGIRKFVPRALELLVAPEFIAVARKS